MGIRALVRGLESVFPVSCCSVVATLARAWATRKKQSIPHGLATVATAFSRGASCGLPAERASIVLAIACGRGANGCVPYQPADQGFRQSFRRSNLPFLAAQRSCGV